MELDVNGATVKDPSAADIVRALAAPSFAEGWYIALYGANAALDARAQGDGSFRLSYGNDQRRPPATVDAATVKETYLEFLAANEHVAPYQPQLKFVPDRRTLTGRSGDEPPFLAMVVMVAIITLVGFAFAMERWAPGFIRHHVPGGDSDYFWVGLIFLPMVALLVVAGATKLIELHAAKNWSETTARIVRSQTAVRRHQFEGEPETVTNVPDVEYEFTVGGRTVHGMRIGIGDPSDDNIEAVLKRYPVGATVPVYYDPRDPKNCVLERDFTQDLKDSNLTKGQLLGGCAEGLVLLAVIGIAIYALATYGPDFVRAHFPRLHSHAEMPVALVGFGLVALLFFFGARRTAKQAAKWPAVRGKIVKSEVEEYQERDEDSDGRTTWRTAYRPAVEYAYAVGGRDYRGNQISYGMTISAGKGFAEKVAAKFPLGGEIDVHYDPKEPSHSALQTKGGAGATWIIFGIAMVVFALAAALLGVFG
jgi:hypothetical protein